MPKSAALVWEVILFDDQIIDRDIEWMEDGGPIIRGRITKVEEKGDEIYFKLAWSARQTLDAGGSWYHDSTTGIGFSRSHSSLELMPDGQVEVNAHHFAKATIYPPGQNLNLGDVKGAQSSTGLLN